MTRMVGRIFVMSAALVVLGAAAATAQTPATPGPGAPAVMGANFVDANGDGICDRFQAGTPGAQARGQGQVQGPRDGTGRQVRRSGKGAGAGQGVGPGSGAGPGSGTCDGTGPKGRRAGR